MAERRVDVAVDDAVGRLRGSDATARAVSRASRAGLAATWRSSTTSPPSRWCFRVTIGSWRLCAAICRPASSPSARGRCRTYRLWNERGELVITEGTMIDYARIERGHPRLVSAIRGAGYLLRPVRLGATDRQSVQRRVAGADGTQERENLHAADARARDARASIGRFRHDGNTCLRWQASNVVVIGGVDDSHPAEEGRRRNRRTRSTRSTRSCWRWAAGCARRPSRNPAIPCWWWDEAARPATARPRGYVDRYSFSLAVEGVRRSLPSGERSARECAGMDSSPSARSDRSTIL